MWRSLPQVGSIPKARSSHSVTGVGRKVYVFGGENEPRVPVDDDVFCYDLDQDTWIKCNVTGERPPSRLGHAAVAIGTKVYVLGGRRGVKMGEECLDDIYAFDTETNIWAKVEQSGAIPEARCYHSVRVHDNHMYVFGGCSKVRFNDLHRFDLTTHTWEELPTSDAVLPRGGPGLAIVDGILYVAGGFRGIELNDMHTFDISTQQWSELKPVPNIPPISVFGFVPVGKLLVLFGGETSPCKEKFEHLGVGTFSHDTYIFDTMSPEKGWNVLETQGDVPSARAWLPITATSAGEVVAFGGNSPTNDRLNEAFVLKLDNQ